MKLLTLTRIGVACTLLAVPFAVAGAKPEQRVAPVTAASTPAATDDTLVVVSNIGEGNLYAALFTKPGGWVDEFVNQGVRKDGKHCLETEEPQWYCGPRNGYALHAHCKATAIDDEGNQENWYAVTAPEEFIFKNAANMSLYEGVRVAYINGRFIDPTAQSEQLPDCDTLLGRYTQH